MSRNIDLRDFALELAKPEHDIDYIDVYQDYVRIFFNSVPTTLQRVLVQVEVNRLTKFKCMLERQTPNLKSVDYQLRVDEEKEIDADGNVNITRTIGVDAASVYEALYLDGTYDVTFNDKLLGEL